MESSADTLQKALQINLDPRWYGTIAEIGAGQEVARWLFRAGGAAGTGAESMSAYDMAGTDPGFGQAGPDVFNGRPPGDLDPEVGPAIQTPSGARGGKAA